VKAVGFTGSLGAGKRLMQLAAGRPEPIPCFMEMSSTNPFFVLPEALKARASSIAGGLFTSFTLGLGQMCTKPGLIFLPVNGDADLFVKELAGHVNAAGIAPMLTEGIHNHYISGVKERQRHAGVEMLAQAGSATEADALPALLQTSGSDVLQDAELRKELFGPCTLIARYKDRDELFALANALEGQLTATVHGTDEDFAEFGDLLQVLEGKAGRLIVNGYPTGVEVCHAMIHGGPYPSTSDSRFTSVGSQAIFRFARPVCFQDFPQALLPDELKDENPLGVWRMINGALTRDAVVPKA